MIPQTERLSRLQANRQALINFAKPSAPQMDN